MLYTAVDTEKKQVVDIIPHGDESKFMKEFVDYYKELTGQDRQFASLDEAKTACVEAVHARTFGRQESHTRPPWLKEDGSPTVEPRAANEGGAEPEGAIDYNAIRNPDGPVAKARAIFEKMWGAPRKDIIEACAQAGIKRSTASTQYQHFKKAQESATDHRNPQNGMPQLAPGVRVAETRPQERH